MLRAIERNGPSKPIRFYCSSAGNAGLGCATAAVSLNRPATIVVPQTAAPSVIAKLKRLGADVHQHGSAWAEADNYLRTALLAHDKNGIYVPPFDHEDIWQGASTLVPELDEQLGDYDAVVCSVGGGGLFNGIMDGLQKRKVFQKKVVQVLTMETFGAHTLYNSIVQKKHLTLPAITSIATSLGCPRVSDKTWKWAQRDEVTSFALSDRDAALACVRFADDERIIVEPACGVSIAPVYTGHLRDQLGKRLSDEEWAIKKVVIVVCGGSNVTLRELEEYKKKYAVADTKKQTEGMVMARL